MEMLRIARGVWSQADNATGFFESLRLSQNDREFGRETFRTRSHSFRLFPLPILSLR